MRLMYNESYTNELFTHDGEYALIGPAVVKYIIETAGREGEHAHYSGVSLAELAEAIERKEIPDVLDIECWSADKLGKATFVLNIMLGIDTAFMTNEQVFARMGIEGYRWDGAGRVWTREGVRGG